MISPNRAFFDRHEPGTGFSQATHMNPNPRFFKYLWRIYTADSPWEGDDFFANAPWLCTHDAMRMIESLSKAGQSHIIYNCRLPRAGPDVPFDFESPRWKDYEVACAYDDDPDPVWNGFK